VLRFFDVCECAGIGRTSARPIPAHSHTSKKRNTGSSSVRWNGCGAESKAPT